MIYIPTLYYIYLSRIMVILLLMYFVMRRKILAGKREVHDEKIHAVLPGFVERQSHQYGSVAQHDRQEQYP